MVAGRPRLLTSTSFGCFIVDLANCSMFADIVAENKSVWRFVGSIASTRRIAGRNPMSSMRSASSRTRTSTLDKLTAPRSVRSSSRPGVAINTAAPRRRLEICVLMFAPPITVTLRLALVRFNSP